MNKHFVVLGAGTVGWLTALYVRYYFPDSKITVLRDKNIKVIGVGESTIPAFIQSLRLLKINIADVFRFCNSTVKKGISFENWNGDGEKYIHAFESIAIDYSIPGLFDNDCAIQHYKRIIFENKKLREHVYAHRVAYENKVDLDLVYNAMQFDAGQISIFLEKTSLERNIEIVEGKYVSCNLDNNDFIKELILSDDRKISCDFVFDCSGFNSSILHNFYRIQKKYYSDFLPMNTAIPFWIDHKDNEGIKPYTIATAMKNGWSWQIPLQHRIGAGYVFDSNYVSIEDAIIEAEEFYKQKIDVRNVIKFEAHRLEKFWHKNCIGVGLASGFLEPLESTSFFLSVHNLEAIRYYLNEIIDHDDSAIDNFNNTAKISWDIIADFIYLHYITKRKDSKFWQEFRYKTKPRKDILQIIELLKANRLKHTDIGTVTGMTGFGLQSYYQVGYGLELNDPIDSLGRYSNIVPSMEENSNRINDLVSKALTHEKAIEILKNGQYTVF